MSIEGPAVVVIVWALATAALARIARTAAVRLEYRALDIFSPSSRGRKDVKPLLCSRASEVESVEENDEEV